jgi:hypothetical protein
LAEGKAMPGEEGIDGGEVGGGEAGGALEEEIHGADDEVRAPAGGAGVGLAEVGEEPAGIGCGEGGDAGQDLGELMVGKAVEEEVGDDEVELAGRGRPVEDVGVDEGDVGVGEAEAGEAGAGVVEHFGAGVEAGELGIGMEWKEFGEEAAVAFAEEEDAAGRGNGGEKGGAAAVEFGAGEEPFHPAIVGREEVEVGGGSGCRGALGELPPAPGEDGAGGVGDDVQGVAGGVHDVGANAFKEDGPADEVGGNFEGGGPGVARAEMEEVVDEKEGRQRAGDEEGVVEPVMEEGDMDVGLDEPAVGGVERAAGEEERVEQIGEPLHSSANMTRPKPRPSRTLSKMVMERVYQIMARGQKPGGVLGRIICEDQGGQSFPGRGQEKGRHHTVPAHTFKPTKGETYGDAEMFHAFRTRGMRGARFPGVCSGKGEGSVVNVAGRDDLARRHLLQVVKLVAVGEREGRISRAEGKAAAAATSQVGLDLAGHRGGSQVLGVFQRPALLGAVDLTEVVDAGIRLRSGAGAREVGNRDGCQETDDGNHYHDFYQREPRISWLVEFHNCLLTFHFECGLNKATGGYNNYELAFNLIAGCQPHCARVAHAMPQNAMRGRPLPPSQNYGLIALNPCKCALFRKPAKLKLSRTVQPIWALSRKYTKIINARFMY